MALDFNNKIPEWKNEGIEPTDELKEKGFKGGYKPPATVFNWFWSLVQKCITELQNQFSTMEDKKLDKSGGTVTDDLKVEGNLILDSDLNVTGGCIEGASSVSADTFCGDLDGNASTATSLKNALTLLLSGVSQCEYDGSLAKEINITAESLGINLSKIYTGKSTIISETTDWNSITEAGTYLVNMSAWGDANSMHGPNQYADKDSNVVKSRGLLLVFKEGAVNNRLIQIYCPYVSGGETNQTLNVILTRLKNTNASNIDVWTTWTAITKGHTHTLTDTDISGVLPISKGGTGASTLPAGYVIVGNGEKTVDFKYISNDIVENSNDIVVSGAIFKAMESKANTEHKHTLDDITETDLRKIMLNTERLKLESLSKSQIIVAASDTDERLKCYADYICTGIADDAVIQQALDDASTGCEIKLLAGNYNMGNPININKQVSIIGSGLNTVITCVTGSTVAVSKAFFYINYKDNVTISEMLTGVQISNLCLSRGLCYLNGNYITANGGVYSKEYPDELSKPVASFILLGTVDKIKFDSVQFKNTGTSTVSNVIHLAESTNLSNMSLVSCYHTIGNNDFNGYWLDMALENININNVSVLFSNCANTKNNIAVNIADNDDIYNTLKNRIKSFSIDDIQFYRNNQKVIGG